MLNSDPDRAFYGPKEVFAAAEESAIEKLLITDDLFRCADSRAWASLSLFFLMVLLLLCSLSVCGLSFLDFFLSLLSDGAVGLVFFRWMEMDEKKATRSFGFLFLFVFVEEETEESLCCLSLV